MTKKKVLKRSKEVQERNEKPVEQTREIWHAVNTIAGWQFIRVEGR